MSRPRVAFRCLGNSLLSRQECCKHPKGKQENKVENNQSLNPGLVLAGRAGEFLIGNDLLVTRLGFGTMRITGKGIWGQPVDRAEALRVLRRAVELGVNFIDTADSYGPGVSEEIIAEALYLIRPTWRSPQGRIRAAWSRPLGRKRKSTAFEVRMRRQPAPVTTGPN